ncbi:MAG: hypothetical protein SGPRY_004053, partial [Prymnesium sp.]
MLVGAILSLLPAPRLPSPPLRCAPPRPAGASPLACALEDPSVGRDDLGSLPSVGDTLSGPDMLGALPSVGETLQGIDPRGISVEMLPLTSPMPLPRLLGDHNFVSIFRSCTPYIKMHQGKKMVFHLCSELLDAPSLFDEFMSEIAILALLGVRPVLMVATRQQVDRKLREQGHRIRYAQGHRISDEVTINTMREVSGFARSRVEGALARGKMGPTSGVGVDVVGGNFFYTAQPLGVRGGVDFALTGEVRRVDDVKINQHLANGEIVMMTSLGYSASGAVFNVRTEALASKVAAAVGAVKLVYITPGVLLKKVRAPPCSHER